MAAYLIGQIAVRDERLWSQYVSGVAESLRPYSAKVLFRGQRFAVLAGETDRDLSVVIEFVDQQTLQAWFDSDAYQKLIPLRDQAADVTIVGYNG